MEIWSHNSTLWAENCTMLPTFSCVDSTRVYDGHTDMQTDTYTAHSQDVGALHSCTVVSIDDEIK